jgi:hypothetical protein
MSNDTTYTIRIEIASERAEALEQFLNEALPEDTPYERKTVMTYEHMRNLGVIASAREGDRKTVEEILSQTSKKFPEALINMDWRDEYGQEGGESWGVYDNEDGDSDKDDSDEDAPGGTIDLELVERFLEEPHSSEWCNYTRIQDAAAEALSKVQDELNLDNLTELSDAAAESLSKLQGDLWLCGLKGLSDAAAESLSKLQGDLWLLGLTEISDPAAESLSRHQMGLHFGFNMNLSVEAAVALSKHQGDLDLETLELSDEIALALCNHRGNLLLDGDWIRTMDTSVVSILATKKGTINEESPRKWIESLGVSVMKLRDLDL